MKLVEQRWTCPTCGTTLVVSGPELDCHCSVIACQLRHGRAHAAAAAVFARVGYPERPKKRRAA